MGRVIMIATPLVIGVKKRGNRGLGDEQDGGLVDREHNPKAVC